MPTIVAISDTHSRLLDIEDSFPEGDILIHSGDHCGIGSIAEWTLAMRDLKIKAEGKYKHVVVVGGNHDAIVEKQPALAKQIASDYGAILLNHESIELEGLKIFGSPYSPTFYHWYSMRDRGPVIAREWDLIPEDTQVLITHSPPMGILDWVMDFNNNLGEFEKSHVGCLDLFKRIEHLKQLKCHIFGHLHDAYGTKQISNVLFINASTCNENYFPLNLPIVASL